MASQLQWYNDEQTILLYELSGSWTVQELIDTVEQSHTMIAQLPHTVHIIHDFTHSGTPPSNLLRAARAIERSIPPNRGIVVGIALGSLLEMLVRVSRVIAPRATEDTYFVATLDEAVALINQHITQHKVAR